MPFLQHNICMLYCVFTIARQVTIYPPFTVFYLPQPPSLWWSPRTVVCVPESFFSLFFLCLVPSPFSPGEGFSHHPAPPPPPSPLTAVSLLVLCLQESVQFPLFIRPSVRLDRRHPGGLTLTYHRLESSVSECSPILRLGSGLPQGRGRAQASRCPVCDRRLGARPSRQRAAVLLGHPCLLAPVFK